MWLFRLCCKASLHVIIAMPAVMFLDMWWAAVLALDSSGSNEKSFLTIISTVVRHILMQRSTTGERSSWTARSIAGLMHCLRCGNCWNNGIWKADKTYTYYSLYCTIHTENLPLLNIKNVPFNFPKKISCSFPSFTKINVSSQHRLEQKRFSKQDDRQS